MPSHRASTCNSACTAVRAGRRLPQRAVVSSHKWDHGRRLMRSQRWRSGLSVATSRSRRVSSGLSGLVSWLILGGLLDHGRRWRNRKRSPGGQSAEQVTKTWHRSSDPRAAGSPSCRWWRRYSSPMRANCCSWQRRQRARTHRTRATQGPVLAVAVTPDGTQTGVSAGSSCCGCSASRA